MLKISFQGETPFKSLKCKDVFLYKNTLYMKIVPHQRYYAQNESDIINTLIISDGAMTGCTIHFDEDTMVIPLESELSCWFKEKDKFSY